MKLNLKEAVSNILAYLLQVERKKLLWTNTAVSSGFSSQTIAMDLTGYDQIEVWFTIWGSDARHNAIHRTEKNRTAVAFGMASSSTNGGTEPNLTPMSGTVDMTERPFYFDDSGIQFGNAREGMNGLNSNGNHVLIPYRIYGIKSGGYCVTQLLQHLQPSSRLGVA